MRWPQHSRWDRYSLILSKITWCYVVHSKAYSSHKFKSSPKEHVQLTVLVINLQKKLIWLSNHCNSFFIFSGWASMIALVLFLSTSIPFWWTKTSRKLPAYTLMAYLRGFILNLCLLICSKAIVKWPKCSSSFGMWHLHSWGWKVLWPIYRSPMILGT